MEKVDRQGKSKGGREEEEEEEDVRWWQEAIRISKQKQPTSKSLSNLIGVIESFRLLRHWADEVNIAMKSAPPHNDVCNHISSYWTLWAWWRQMFGLEMGKHCTNRLSFYLWEERDVYKWNTGCNWLSKFNHFTDLLSIRSHNLSSLRCAAYKYSKILKLDMKAAAEHLKGLVNKKKASIPRRDWKRSHLFICYRTWLSAHGPLGVRICLLLLSVILHFSEPHPHLLSLHGGQVSRQMANRQWGSIPWGSTSLEWPFHAASQMGIMRHTHTYTHTSAT